MPVTAISRRTCLGSSFDRLLYRTRVLRPGDQVQRLVDQVLLPDLLPGDIMLLSSRAVSACQGRLLPLASAESSRLAVALSAIWRRLASEAPLGCPAVMQAALEQDGVATMAGSVLSHFWRKARGEAAAYPRSGFRGLLRTGSPTDLALYRGQLILPPRSPEQLVTELWKRTGYRAAIVAVRQPGEVQIAALSPGLSPEYIRALVLDNPLGAGDQQTPIAILRKRRKEER